MMQDRGYFEDTENAIIRHRKPSLSAEALDRLSTSYPVFLNFSSDPDTRDRHQYACSAVNPLNMVRATIRKSSVKDQFWR